MKNNRRWTLTDEHKAQIPAWNQRWINIARRTRPMDDDDRRLLREGIIGMYSAAKLPAPKIVIVPSPLMAAIVAGAACAYWHCLSANPATDAATADATAAVTRAATADATADATAAATRAATRAATYDVTRAATRAATYDATDAATYAATNDATNAVTRAATAAATYDATADATADARSMIDTAWSVVTSKIPSIDRAFFLGCVANSYRLRSGGNHWSAWPCYLSFVRDVVGWQHPSHKHYRAYELAVIHGSWRYSHAKFCVVSNFPTRLKFSDEPRNPPHCDTGPSHQWKDGWKLWHIDGIRLDKDGEQIVMRPETQTIAQIDGEPNNDIRAIRIKRFGWVRYLKESGCQCIDRRQHPRDLTAEELYVDKGKRHRFVVVDPATNERVCLLVPRDCRTCAAAQSFLSHGADDRAMVRT